MVLSGILADLFHEFLISPFADGVIFIQPLGRRDRKAGIDQAFLNRHGKSGIDFSRSRTAFDGPPCAAAIEGNGAGLCQREGLISFQKQGTSCAVLS